MNRTSGKFFLLMLLVIVLTCLVFWALIEKRRERWQRDGRYRLNEVLANRVDFRDVDFPLSSDELTALGVRFLPIIQEEFEKNLPPLGDQEEDKYRVFYLEYLVTLLGSVPGNDSARALLDIAFHPREGQPDAVIHSALRTLKDRWIDCKVTESDLAKMLPFVTTSSFDDYENYVVRILSQCRKLSVETRLTPILERLDHLLSRGGGFIEIAMPHMLAAVENVGPDGVAILQHYLGIASTEPERRWIAAALDRAKNSRVALHSLASPVAP